MWDTNILKKWLGLVVLMVALFVLHQLFHISSIFYMPMGSLHTWRQADCISATNEMYNGTGTLFYPTTHYIKSDGTRYAAGEFPIVNALVANIYKITGPKTSVYRKTVYAFYWIGMIFLYLIFYEVSKRWLNSVLLTILLGASSVFVFYAVNFLPDVPALSVAIVGLYYWIKARKKNRISSYLISVLLIVLACLIKITIGILLGSAMMVLIVEWIMHERRKFHLPVLGCMFAGCILIVAWYYHAYQLDHQHPPFIFLTETRSFLQTFPIERPLIWKEVSQTWLPQVYVPIVGYFIIGGSLVAILLSKATKIEQILFAGCALSGGFIFFFIMYRQFLFHDYLWVTLLIVPIIFSILMIQGVGHVKMKIFQWTFSLMLISLISAQTLQTSLILRERYFRFETKWVYNPNLIRLKDELRNHGIKKTDAVIIVPDNSPNISLSLLDQYGYTFYRQHMNKEKFIDQKIQEGAEYLIITDLHELNRDYVHPFINLPLFMCGDVHVYDLRIYKRANLH